MNKSVSEALLEKARNTHDASEALAFTQAALNAEQVKCIEAQSEHMRVELAQMAGNTGS